jgi:hypothetical protein
MKIMYFLLLLSVSSCASTLTDDEQYEKDDREVVRLERFQQAVAECEAAHGYIVIEGIGSSAAPTDGKYEMPGTGQKYYCKGR